MKRSVTPAERKFRAVSFSAIGSGAAFIPITLAVTEPPRVFQWGLFISIALIGGAAAILLTTRFITSSPQAPSPIRLLGTGIWLGTFGLLLLAVYFCLNAIDDIQAPPRIYAVRAIPQSIEPGGIVELQVDAQDQDKDDLDVRWYLGKELIGHLQTTYFNAPKRPGVYKLQVQVADDRSTVRESVNIIVKPVTP